MLTDQTVLFHYLLEKFGFTKFENLRNKYRDYELDWDCPSNSILFQMLSKEKLEIDIIKLREYEENIIAHLSMINSKRATKINLKYFQFFALLFTEYYLDNYFENKHEFCEDLNKYLHKFNREYRTDLPHYLPEQLNKLSYWAATGSGKTFLLHFNILQLKHYTEKQSIKVRDYILLTPSEMLSKQHLEELEADSIDSDYFLNYSDNAEVKVIDIYKVREAKKGEGVTIGVDTFEDSNALFVDEGHKGSSGEDESTWRMLREKIGYKGFTFEYSATFGQINGTLQKEYAKNIIFDYSYGKFHKDGYGKDYWIHNISDNTKIEHIEEKRNYLLLNMMLFAQQILFYKNNKIDLEEYQTEHPLLIFVGHTVNPKATTKGDKEDNKITVSDVKILIEFINDYLTNAGNYKDKIDKLLKNDGLYKEDYYEKLSYLRKRLNTKKKIYDFIIKEVMNAEQPDKLVLMVLAKADGEIALKVKGSESYFGLINIGDVSTFKTSLQDEIEFAQDKFTEPLFEALSAKKDKPVNILIGARKFIEGWNNYRVSSIGLINFGKAEGAQIIQLFGRGVRLKGKDNSLKRTDISEFHNINIAETLNIFGLNADYMKRFRDDLIQEGLRVKTSEKIFKIVPKKSINKLGLLSLKKKTDVTAFRFTDEIKLDLIDDIKVIIDLSIHKIVVTAKDQEEESSDNKVEKITDELLTYVDWNKIYLGLLRYKQQKKYDNLRIERSKVKELFGKIRFEIYRDTELGITSYVDIGKLNKIALMILEQYCKLFYDRKLKEYEGRHIETETLTNDNSNFQDIDYVVEFIETDEDGEPLRGIDDILKEVEEVIKCVDPVYPLNLKDKHKNIIKNSWLEEHLYQPLLDDEDGQELTAGGKKIISNIKPKGLNKGERDFITDLRYYITNKEAYFEDKEIFLLRNQSKKGFGFYFEASGGFYPDFILWIKYNDKQYLTFIDPHGLGREKKGFQSEKIQLHKTIKELQKDIGKKDLILNSFILTPTESSEISHFKESEKAEDYNVLEIGEKYYIERMIKKIIS